jgi:hypothetical protein
MEGITEQDMSDYMPPDEVWPIEAYFLGQFYEWDSHRNARWRWAWHAVLGCAPAWRRDLLCPPAPGNLWTFENLDNAQTGLHDYFMWLKFGFGRGCQQASVDIRSGRLTRAETLPWVERNDGAFPEVYAGVHITEVLDRIGMTRDQLDACIDRFSGKAQKFPVARGLSRGDGLNIDTGIGRGLLDAAKISGTDTGLSNELISVCRAIEDGTHANNVNTANRKSRSNSEKLALVDLHREAGNWVCTNGPRGKTIRSSIVLGAMGRAWYLESDKDRLRRFADVLGSGFQAGDEESAAIALRNYIQSKEALSSSALWRDTFLKVQNAISYFMRGKKLTVIKGVADESYPLRKVPHRRAKA